MVNHGRIMSYKYFGSMNLLGFYMKDTVCILADSDYCVDKFIFFEIAHAKGLQTDGILGLSPYRSDKHNSIVAALAHDNIIQREIATFCLHKEENAVSTVTFGGVPDGCRVSNETFSLNLVKGYEKWWTVWLGDLKYGNERIK